MGGSACAKRTWTSPQIALPTIAVFSTHVGARLRARQRIRSSSLSLFTCARRRFAFRTSAVSGEGSFILRRQKGNLADGITVCLPSPASKTSKAMALLVSPKRKIASCRWKVVSPKRGYLFSEIFVEFFLNRGKHCSLIF